MPHSERRKKRCGRDCTLSVRHGPDCSYFSLRFSFQFNTVSVVYEQVKNGIRQGGIGDAAVPLVNWDLCRDQGGGVAKAVIQDFENVLRILDRNGIAHPVVEDQQTAAGERTQGGSEGTIGTDLGEGME